MTLCEWEAFLSCDFTMDLKVTSCDFKAIFKLYFLTTPGPLTLHIPLDHVIIVISYDFKMVLRDFLGMFL